MADLLKKAFDIIWTESFWLPGNRSWDVLKNTDNGIYHAQISDLAVPVYLSFVVSVVKYVCENYIFASIGRSLGLKSTVKKAPENPKLEKAYSANRSQSNEMVQGLVKQTDLTARQIERWFRVRRNQDRTPVLKKFIESAWRLLFYFAIFWWGLYIHLDKPWFYNTIDCWRGWPDHHVTNDVYWYYMLEGAFYLSLLYSLFTDHKRKDFVEMVVHHVATIMLMMLSWVNNFARVGTLVLLVHDAVDSWMEAAKLCKYAGRDKLCEVFFFIFLILWICTRMTIFPFRIIYSTMFESLPNLGEKTNGLFTIYVVYNFLLCTLQVLHIIWFYYISLIAWQAISGRELQKDSRSSSEEISEEDDNPDNKITDSKTVSSNGVDNKS